MRYLIVFLFLIYTSTAALADINTGVDESAKLPYWELNAFGLSLRLVQRLPDQSRAFFAARGFQQREVERIAQSCIFQSVLKSIVPINETTRLTYDLTRWKITHKNKVFHLKTRENWRLDWQQAKVKQAARIAFEWALLPTKQKYQPQDNNWGMTSFNLPPGSRFDLTVVWTYAGVDQSALIKNIQCAADVHLEPGDSVK